LDDLVIVPTDAGVALRVRVKPRASKSRVVGVRDGELEVAISAPPVDGEANAELTRFMAKILGVSRGSVAVQRGEASRHKTVSVRGVDSDAVRRMLTKAVP
jgi:uncharacterized protein (TIGR00251 family)